MQVFLSFKMGNKNGKQVAEVGSEEDATDEAGPQLDPNMFKVPIFNEKGEVVGYKDINDFTDDDLGATDTHDYDNIGDDIDDGDDDISVTSADMNDPELMSVLADIAPDLVTIKKKEPTLSNIISLCKSLFKGTPEQTALASKLSLNERRIRSKPAIEQSFLDKRISLFREGEDLLEAYPLELASDMQDPEIRALMMEVGASVPVGKPKTQPVEISNPVAKKAEQELKSSRIPESDALMTELYEIETKLLAINRRLPDLVASGRGPAAQEMIVTLTTTQTSLVGEINSILHPKLVLPSKPIMSKDPAASIQALSSQISAILQQALAAKKSGDVAKAKQLVLQKRKLEAEKEALLQQQKQQQQEKQQEPDSESDVSSVNEEDMNDPELLAALGKVAGTITESQPVVQQSATKTEASQEPDAESDVSSVNEEDMNDPELLAALGKVAGETVSQQPPAVSVSKVESKPQDIPTAPPGSTPKQVAEYLRQQLLQFNSREAKDLSERLLQTLTGMQQSFEKANVLKKEKKQLEAMTFLKENKRLQDELKNLITQSERVLAELSKNVSAEEEPDAESDVSSVNEEDMNDPELLAALGKVAGGDLATPTPSPNLDTRIRELSTQISILIQNALTAKKSGDLETAKQLMIRKKKLDAEKEDLLRQQQQESAAKKVHPQSEAFRAYFIIYDQNKDGFWNLSETNRALSHTGGNSIDLTVWGQQCEYLQLDPSKGLPYELAMGEYIEGNADFEKDSQLSKISCQIEDNHSKAVAAKASEDITLAKSLLTQNAVLKKTKQSIVEGSLPTPITTTQPDSVEDLDSKINSITQQALTAKQSGDIPKARLLMEERKRLVELQQGSQSEIVRASASEQSSAAIKPKDNTQLTTQEKIQQLTTQAIQSKSAGDIIKAKALLLERRELTEKLEAVSGTTPSNEDDITVRINGIKKAAQLARESGDIEKAKKLLSEKISLETRMIRNKQPTTPVITYTDEQIEYFTRYDLTKSGYWTMAEFNTANQHRGDDPFTVASWQTYCATHNINTGRGAPKNIVLLPYTVDGCSSNLFKQHNQLSLLSLTIQSERSLALAARSSGDMETAKQHMRNMKSAESQRQSVLSQPPADDPPPEPKV